MGDNKAHYFALDGGMSYKKILQHFREQAKGNGKTVRLPVSKGSHDKRRHHNKNHMVLIDMAEPTVQDKKSDDVMPKIEMIDPQEAIRRTAMDGNG